MLNQVNFEGFVVNSWTFGNDIFVRMASYRDPGQPIKRLNESKDEPDYVNVRFTNAANQLTPFPSGTLLRVEGLLQSREYNETLDEFLKKARKNGTTQGVELTGAASKIVSGRSTVEILARQHVIILQPDKEKKAARKENTYTPRLAPEATAKHIPDIVIVKTEPVEAVSIPEGKAIKKNKPVAVPEA